MTLATSHTLEVVDAGVMEYQAAWDMQLALHEQVLQGAKPAGVLMLVEHPPVITIGRRPNAVSHLNYSVELLAQRGVQVIETDRGGDITFHGPGQLVAYPIIPLNYYGLNLHGYMRAMEDVVIATLAAFNVATQRLDGCTGVWVVQQIPDAPAAEPLGSVVSAKICAMGIKLKRWITLHGLALNVTTDLAYFDLINPCGLGRPVTSLQKLLGPACPSMQETKSRLVEQFRRRLNESLCSIA